MDHQPAQKVPLSTAHTASVLRTRSAELTARTTLEGSCRATGATTPRVVRTLSARLSSRLARPAHTPTGATRRGERRRSSGRALGLAASHAIYQPMDLGSCGTILHPTHEYMHMCPLSLFVSGQPSYTRYDAAELITMGCAQSKITVGQNSKLKIKPKTPARAAPSPTATPKLRARRQAASAQS